VATPLMRRPVPTSGLSSNFHPRTSASP